MFITIIYYLIDDIFKYIINRIINFLLRFKSPTYKHSPSKSWYLIYFVICFTNIINSISLQIKTVFNSVMYLKLRLQMLNM